MISNKSKTFITLYEPVYINWELHETPSNSTKSGVISSHGIFCHGNNKCSLFIMKNNYIIIFLVIFHLERRLCSIINSQDRICPSTECMQQKIQGHFHTKLGH